MTHKNLLTESLKYSFKKKRNSKQKKEKDWMNSKGKTSDINTESLTMLSADIQIHDTETISGQNNKSIHQSTIKKLMR